MTPWASVRHDLPRMQWEPRPPRMTWGQRLTIAAIAVIGAALFLALLYGLQQIAKRVT